MKKRVIIDPNAIAYLKNVSSEMKALIEIVEDVETYYETDPFTALVSQVFFQLISFKAATTIWERFLDNYGPITPESILSLSFDELRSVGLTKSKTAYIRNIANAFKNNEINTNWKDMNDEEVINEVTKIKGIGEWTGQMFLVFCLKRPNVLSYGDIALRKGIEWLFNFNHKITEKEFDYYRQLFSPYNTTAAYYIWEITLRNCWTKKLI